MTLHCNKENICSYKANKVRKTLFDSMVSVNLETRVKNIRNHSLH